eukprot:g12664.t1
MERALAPPGVVFFAFWQGLVLQLLGWLGILHEGHSFLSTFDNVELAWQDLLVCVEMGVLFSLLNIYAFFLSPYQSGPKPLEKTKKKQ